MNFFRSNSIGGGGCGGGGMFSFEPPTERRDLYECLGLRSSATQDDIKKAFRTASLKHHPDKNPGNNDAQNKFQSINEAYSILSDPQKRQSYDFYCSMPTSQNPFSGGRGGVSGVSGVSGVGGEDILAQIFKAMAGGGGRVNSNRGGSSDPIFMRNVNGWGGINIIYSDENIDDMFEDILGDIVRQDRHDVKPMMSSLPLQQSPQPQPPQPPQKPDAITAQLEVTMYEVYTGAQIPLQIERWVMNHRNRSRTQERETIYVPIYRGIDDGEIITIPEKGHVASESCRGDVKVTIRVSNATDYKRKGLDLIYVKHLSLKEALCGDFNFELKLLNGDSCTIANKKKTIIPPNSREICHNRGLIRETNGVEQTGNLIIQFVIDFPDKLSESQLERIREIF